MAKYVTFFTYTSESWAQMIQSPGDRTVAVRQLVDKLGGSLECAYWMFGAHDRLVIADVPDSISAAALSVTVGSTGAFKSLETHELLTEEQVGPATVHFVDELPNTPSGKVQRYVLRQRRRGEALVRTAEEGDEAGRCWAVGRPRSFELTLRHPCHC